MTILTRIKDVFNRVFTAKNGKPKNKGNKGNKIKSDDITQLCRRGFADVSYYDLKRDRKLILDLLNSNTVQSEALLELMVRTLLCIDGRLKQFSDEEKAIYDAVYGDNI